MPCMARNLGLVALALALALIAGCTGDDRARRTSREFNTSGGAGGPVERKTVDLAGGGTVKGKVTFQGEAPRRVVLQISEAVCVVKHTEKVYSENVVIGADGGLRDCLVYLDMADAYEVPATAVEINQDGCVYLPHVVSLMAGQELLVRNSDETLHNVHWIPVINPEENFGMAKPGERAKSFEDPELGILLKCDVHPWMRGHIHVLSHPFHAVTGEDGTFEIPGVPAGTHTLKLWHDDKGIGEQTVTITVTAQQETNQDFTVNG